MEGDSNGWLWSGPNVVGGEVFLTNREHLGAVLRESVSALMLNEFVEFTERQKCVKMGS